MPIKRKVTKPTDKDETINKYIDAMKEVAQQFKPEPYTPMETKSIVYNYEDSSPISELVFRIMQQLDGHTIEDIVAASNVVEQYVKAQSKGQLFTYSPTGRYGV